MSTTVNVFAKESFRICITRADLNGFGPNPVQAEVAYVFRVSWGPEPRPPVSGVGKRKRKSNINTLSICGVVSEASDPATLAEKFSSISSKIPGSPVISFDPTEADQKEAEELRGGIAVVRPLTQEERALFNPTRFNWRPTGE